MQIKKKIVEVAQNIVPDSIRFHRKRMAKKDNIRTGNWLKHKARKAYGRDVVAKGVVRDTNLEAWLILPLETKYRERMLQELQETYRFSFDSMLIIRNPYEKTPLCALLVFETEQECRVRVTVRGKEKGCQMVYATEHMRKQHQVPVMGLYPGWENKVKVELLDLYGKTICKKNVVIPTKNLPEQLNGLVKSVKSSEDTGMPFVFVTGGIGGSTYAFDRQGEIRYYMSRIPRQYGVYPQEDGRFLFPERHINEPTFINPHANVMHDMDYLGRVKETYYVEGGLHHWVVPIPGTDGRIVLGAGSSMKRRMEDAIVRYNRNTGEIEDFYDLGDMFFPAIESRYDWAHLNRIVCVDEEHVIVSMRNCHTVAKLHLPSRTVVWILAHPGIYEGTDLADKVLRVQGEDFQHFYQQHAVEVVNTRQRKGTTEDSQRLELMLFDNHCTTKMAVPWFDGKEESYVCFYEIDEAKRTVRMVKRFMCPLSPTRCNGWYDEKKHRVFAMAGAANSVEDCDAARVMEWDFESGELVSDYEVYRGYFRAYPFELTDSELDLKVDVPTVYRQGELAPPVRKEEMSSTDFVGPVLEMTKTAHGVAEEGDEGDSGISLAYMDNLLMVRAQDHAVAKVYFVGKTVWEKDYTMTHQTNEVFAQKFYNVAIPMDRLPAGRYEVWLQLAAGEMVDTGKWVEV